MKNQLALLFPQVPKEHCKQVPKKVEKQVKAFCFNFSFLLSSWCKNEVLHFLLIFQVPRTKCRKVPDKRCQDFPINVPRKECKEFPKTVCTQV